MRTVHRLWGKPVLPARWVSMLNKFMDPSTIDEGVAEVYEALIGDYRDALFTALANQDPVLRRRTQELTVDHFGTSQALVDLLGVSFYKKEKR